MLLNDADNDCRWQALIVIGEHIESNPEDVWNITLEYGNSTDEDMRDGVATVLLEHLLEHFFDRFFPKLEVEIKAGNTLLADTLGRCWPLGKAEHQWHKVVALLRAANSA